MVIVGFGTVVVVLGPAIWVVVPTSAMSGEVEPDASRSFEGENRVIEFVDVNPIVPHAGVWACPVQRFAGQRCRGCGLEHTCWPREDTVVGMMTRYFECDVRGGASQLDTDRFTDVHERMLDRVILVKDRADCVTPVIRFAACLLGERIVRARHDAARRFTAARNHDRCDATHTKDFRFRRHTLMALSEAAPQLNAANRRRAAGQPCDGIVRDRTQTFPGTI